MNIYPVVYEGVEPDQLRSDTNSKSIELRVRPALNNNGVESTDWLGGQYGSNRSACDTIDTDEDGWLDQIEALCGETGIVFDGDEIEAWVDSDPTESLSLDGRTPDIKRGTGWTITVDEDEPFQFDLGAGYTALDQYADGYGNQPSNFPREDWEAVLDAAGIDYDIADFDEYSSSGHASFWTVVVAEGVEDRANALMNIYHAIENGDNIDSDDISNAEFTTEMFLKAL